MNLINILRLVTFSFYFVLIYDHVILVRDSQSKNILYLVHTSRLKVFLVLDFLHRNNNNEPYQYTTKIS